MALVDRNPRLVKEEPPLVKKGPRLVEGKPRLVVIGAGINGLWQVKMALDSGEYSAIDVIERAPKPGQQTTGRAAFRSAGNAESNTDGQMVSSLESLQMNMEFQEEWHKKQTYTVRENGKSVTRKGKDLYYPAEYVYGEHVEDGSPSESVAERFKRSERHNTPYRKEIQTPEMLAKKNLPLFKTGFKEGEFQAHVEEGMKYSEKNKRWEGSAHIDCQETIRALMKYNEERGVTFHFDTEVSDLANDKANNTVTFKTSAPSNNSTRNFPSTSKSWETDKVICAANIGNAKLLKDQEKFPIASKWANDKVMRATTTSFIHLYPEDLEGYKHLDEFPKGEGRLPSLVFKAPAEWDNPWYDREPKEHYYIYAYQTELNGRQCYEICQYANIADAYDKTLAKFSNLAKALAIKNSRESVVKTANSIARSFIRNYLNLTQEAKTASSSPAFDKMYTELLDSVKNLNANETEGITIASGVNGTALLPDLKQVVAVDGNVTCVNNDCHTGFKTAAFVAKLTQMMMKYGTKKDPLVKALTEELGGTKEAKEKALAVYEHYNQHREVGVFDETEFGPSPYTPDCEVLPPSEMDYIPPKEKGKGWDLF